MLTLYRVYITDEDGSNEENERYVYAHSRENAVARAKSKNPYMKGEGRDWTAEAMTESLPLTVPECDDTY